MQRAKGTKRIVIVADLHCGHRAGLTPPEYRYRESSDTHIWRKFTKVQEETWGLYMEAVKALNPITCLVANGDLIDGRGERSGGVELITADRNEQCQMAVECLRKWRFDGQAEKCDTFVVTGTPYHAGDIESWEHIAGEMLATGEPRVRVKVGDHEWPNVNGYIFDCKHFVGGSQVPHGRATAIKREELWNSLWAEAGNQPRADMIVRSHVHYCEGSWKYIGGRKVEAFTTPALQAMGTRYGARKCSGTVDWGLMAFDIDINGRIATRHEWVPIIKSTVAMATKV